ncbi:MAG: DUF6364 family protein [Spirochaetaceae bacterium]|jgi:hypothetical protein|nr:DUF6364 family protein [Spirochaetaceae bacterium]
MYAKLTLNIDQNVIENAKKYAKHQKVSVSKLVEKYLSSISSPANEKAGRNSLGPITKELVGIIKVKGKMDYKELLTDALMEKHN